MKLTYPQERARRSLTAEWQTAWQLHQQAKTMFVLERLGIAEKRRTPGDRKWTDRDDYQWRKL